MADLTSPFQSASGGDADGNPDLVLTYDDFAEVLVGDGDAHFSTSRDLGAVPEPIGVAIGDFDRNGNLDLAFAAFSSIHLICNHRGVYAPCPTDVIETADPIAIIAGDFDADTYIDLAALNRSTKSLLPIFGTGTGTFAVAEPVPTSVEGEQGPVALAVGRLNDDARDDLVVGNTDSFSHLGLLALYGQPDRRFRREGAPVAHALTALALTDLDRDGHLDAAMVGDDPDTPGIVVARGDAFGGFVDGLVVPRGSPRTTGRAMLSGDLNGDGRPDLVILDGSARSVHVALNLPAAPCAGDCDGNGTVAVHELVLAINIALNDSRLSTCSAADVDGFTSVDIDELVTAVHASLAGCPQRFSRNSDRGRSRPS